MFKLTNCDILVIGAGPAGSAAARSAARAGASVICIDKKKELGVPVQCAEGIGRYLFPYLPFKIPSNQLKWRIDGILFRVETMIMRRKGSFWEGFSVDRDSFDKWLSNLASAAGAKVSCATELSELKLNKDGNVASAKLICRGREMIVSPKLVVAADGCNSTVLKLLNKYAPTKYATAEVCCWEMNGLSIQDPHLEQIFIGDFAPGGYGFIFPKSKTVANVGVGGVLINHEKLENHFKEFLELTSTKRQLESGKFVINKSKRAVWSDLTTSWIHGNVVLAGDCANHNLKPFVEGILPAVIGGDLSGKLAVEMIRKNNLIKHHEYFDKLSSVMRPHFEISRNIMFDAMDIFDIPDKKKHLLFFALVTQLFELEKISELKQNNIDSIRSVLLEKSNAESQLH